MTAEYVANILLAYRAASPADIAAGRDWYPAASRIVDAIAEWANVDPPRVAAVMAALSPRNPWQWNVQDCAAVTYAASHGRPMPHETVCPVTVTTFDSNRDTAWRFATGESDWVSS